MNSWAQMVKIPPDLAKNLKLMSILSDAMAWFVVFKVKGEQSSVQVWNLTDPVYSCSIYRFTETADTSVDEVTDDCL